MRFGLSSVCPLSFGSPFIRPHSHFSFFPFMSFCLHVSSSSSFLSLARTFVRTLVCTHTRTRTLLTTRFRWPRFVTMRFGSSVVPLHLVPFHRQPHTHTHLCLSCPSHFHLSLLRAHAPTSFPGRMEVTHASLRGGVRGIIGNLKVWNRGTAWLVTVAVQRRGCYKSLIWILDAESTYLLGCGVDKLLLQSSRKGLMSSADVHATSSPCRSLDRCFLLELLATCNLRDLR